MGIETEAVNVIKELIEKQQNLFVDYRNANDERLVKIEKNEGVSELDAKLAKQDEQFTEYKSQMDKELAALKRLGHSDEDQKQSKSEEKSAFIKLIRHGNGSRMSDTEVKSFTESQEALSHGQKKAEEIKSAMMSGSDPDGGYFVLPELASEITRLVQGEVAMMRVAQNVTTSTSTYQKRVRTSGSGYTWEGEQTHPDATDAPKYSLLAFPVHTLAANPSISQELLQDSDVNVEMELTDSLREDFAQGIGEALVHGEVSAKMPRGILSYPMVDNKNYAWGKVGYIKSGKSDGFVPTTAAAGPGDCLIDLIHSLPRQYRGNGRWMMNDMTTAAIRKFKNTDGDYLWQPSIIVGQPDRLLGYPIETDSKFPDIAAGKCPVAFADFFKAYLVVQRSGMTFIRDPYTNKPFVVFSTRMRIGGGVQNFEAVKLLQIGA